MWGLVLMAWDEAHLTVRTSVAAQGLVIAETELVAMVSLRVGDRFLGLDAAQYVFEVVLGPPSWVPALRDGGRGWLWVRDVSMNEAQARAAIARGDAEPGSDPRDGGYPPSFLPGVRVKKVLRLRTGR